MTENRRKVDRDQVPWLEICRWCPETSFELFTIVDYTLTHVSPSRKEVSVFSELFHWVNQLNLKIIQGCWVFFKFKGAVI